VHWHDEPLHRAAFGSDPALYILCAFARGIHPWQQARILYLLLTESRRILSPSLCAHCERIVLFLLATLPTDLVLSVFLAVRRARANHRHTVRAMLSYLLQHPDIEAMAQSRPREIRDCLEHALGQGRARYFGFHAPQLGRDASLSAPLRRYGGSEVRLRSLFECLYFGVKKGEVRYGKLPYTTPVNEPVASGTLVPLLSRLYRDGTSPELISGLEAAIAGSSADLPSLPGRVALILDASASMRGNSEQPYAPIALAVAFERVLQVRCADLRSYSIGGFGWPPAPEGPTDFGRALLDALEGDPELILFLTDGYENLNEGDAARIVSTLRTLGLSTPVVCCCVDLLAIFPAANVPAIPLRTAEDFEATLQIFDMMIEPQAARTRIVNRLRARQSLWETEVLGWTVAP
jgi:hypothetical protein